MPVPAVMKGGMPTVVPGSAITIAGSSFGWKITFLVCVASLVMTPARPTSEPVPAVVGTATIGAIASASARVHQSPISSKSQTGRVCPAWKAISLPRSSAEPPPKAMTPSCLPFLKAAMPAVRLDSTGLGFTSENTPCGTLASARIFSVAATTGSLARPGSVTNSGRLMPAAASASGSSAMRPAPKRTVVG